MLIVFLWTVHLSSELHITVKMISYGSSICFSLHLVQQMWWKSLRIMDICPNMFLMSLKVFYSEKKICHKGYVLIRKRSEHRDLSQEGIGSLLLCADAVWFMIRTFLIYKATNPQALMGKDKHELTVFCLCYKKVKMKTLFFWICFIDASSLKLEVLCEQGTSL